MLHTIGKPYGIAVALLDFSKGYAVAFICSIFGLPMNIAFVAGFAVILGHDFPVFLKFKGGKGIATTLGFLFGLFPYPTLAALTLMLFLFFIKRYYLFSMTFGIASLPILWMPLFKKDLKEIILTIMLLCVLAVKRLIDIPHMRKIREASGWDKR